MCPICLVICDLTELTEFRRGERLVDQVMFFKGVLAE